MRTIVRQLSADFFEKDVVTTLYEIPALSSLSYNPLFGETQYYFPALENLFSLPEAQREKWSQDLIAFTSDPSISMMWESLQPQEEIEIWGAGAHACAGEPRHIAGLRGIPAFAGRSHLEKLIRLPAIMPWDIQNKRSTSSTPRCVILIWRAVISNLYKNWDERLDAADAHLGFNNFRNMNDEQLPH